MKACAVIAMKAYFNPYIAGLAILRVATISKITRLITIGDLYQKFFKCITKAICMGHDNGVDRVVSVWHAGRDLEIWLEK